VHTTKPQQANKVKNYGQTIQQSRKPETPEQLPQTQENRDQGQESRRSQTGLTGRFRTLKRPLIRAAFLIGRDAALRRPDSAARCPYLFFSANIHGTSTGGDFAIRCMAMISEFVTSATTASAMMAQFPALKTSRAMSPPSRHRP
jgi:hypothetical protein